MKFSFYNLKHFGLMALIGGACLMPSISHAACSSPAGVAGEMGYDVTGTDEYEYCDDTNWVAMHDTVLAIGAGTISAGGSHSCGIGTDDKAYCWGVGAPGQLGDGSVGSHNDPVQVHAGENTGGDFVQVSAGNLHSCGIGTDDKAYCWGEGSNGRLGDNNNGDHNEPVEVHAGENTGGDFVQVSAGDRHSCGIGTDDKAYCWGIGSPGQLGDGAVNPQDEPVEVHAGENTGSDFVQVSAGYDHSCGIGTDGKAYCWGYGANGRLGDGNTGNHTEPVQVHAGENTGGDFVQVSAGDNHSCGIGTDGKAYCWGGGVDGRLGDGNAGNHNDPVEVHAGENTGGDFVQVSAGERHSCGLGTDDKTYCWGYGVQGRLGDGDAGPHDEPVEVHAGENTGGDFVQTSAGGSHSCGLGTDGKAYCWGYGNSGRLGDGNTGNHTEPVQVHAGENTGGDFENPSGSSCTTPGLMSYNSTSHIYEWCGASTLYEVSGTKGVGGAGCSASGSLIAGDEGAMQYDTTNDKMVFCGGTTWIDIPN